MGSDLGPLMSSDSGTWETPDEILNPLNAWFHIDTDPCAGPETDIGKRYNYRGGDLANGLELIWHGTCFVNPPYGRGIEPWLARCADMYRTNMCEVIALVPARTETQWFKHCWNANQILFWEGRLKFRAAPNCAPFPSALVYWGERSERFCDAFGEFGAIH